MKSDDMPSSASATLVIRVDAWKKKQKRGSLSHDTQEKISKKK